MLESAVPVHPEIETRKAEYDRMGKAIRAKIEGRKLRQKSGR